MYSINKTVSLIGACAFIVLSPTTQAVDPPPDGGYPGDNTAEGDSALFSLITGSFNTATGSGALYNNTTGNWNTAVGYQAMLSNTYGGDDTRYHQGSTA